MQIREALSTTATPAWGKREVTWVVTNYSSPSSSRSRGPRDRSDRSHPTDRVVPASAGMREERTIQWELNGLIFA